MLSDDNVVELVSKACSTHEQFISMMKFGTPTFEKKPLLALELITKEAESNRAKAPKTWSVAERVVDIFKRIGWRLEIIGEDWAKVQF